MKYRISLNAADYLSLTALSFAWLSITMIIAGQPIAGLFAQLVAFAFDVADGAVARKLKASTSFGRQLDSAVDFLTYSVVSALVVYRYIAPNFFLGQITGFAIVIFGLLRLLRFNQEGIQQDGDQHYYRGITVVHLALSVVLAFIGIRLFPWEVLPWLVTAGLLGTAPLMLSDVKSIKPKGYRGIFLITFIIALILGYVAYGNP